MEVITTDSFASRILQLRKSKNLSQADFAKALNLSQNFVWMVEKGQREPSDRTMNDICRVFGVDPVWLRTGAGEPFTPLSRSDELAAIFEKVEIGTDEKSRLIRAMARMPDEAFPALLQFVQQLYQNFLEE